MNTRTKPFVVGEEDGVLTCSVKAEQDASSSAPLTLDQTEATCAWFDHLNALQQKRDEEERAWWWHMQLQQETDQ